MRKYRIKKFDDMEINIASFVDIIFLLLLFFIVASTLDTNEIKATIQLPQSDELLNNEIGIKNSIILFLDKNGMVCTEKGGISWDVLPSYLKENIEGFHDSIEVYADKEVNFDYIARIMVIGSKLEIDKINFLLKYEYPN